MVDRSRTGARCYTLRRINSVKGLLPRETYGTLRYEEENLGRRLVFVVWDNGMNVPIFPDEVEVLETETATTA